MKRGAFIALNKKAKKSKSNLLLSMQNLTMVRQWSCRKNKCSDKLFKKFKKSKLHIDKEIYKIARYEVQKLISYKKKKFFDNRLNDPWTNK